MLKHISSTSFIETITLVTAVYYLAVALLFYRTDIRRFVSRKMTKKLQSVPTTGDDS